MFKFIALFAIIAVAAAKPGILHGSPIVYSSAPVVTGTVIKSIPTAVSHQSQSIVHSHGHYASPIVAPVVRSYAAPAIHTYAASPLTYAASPLTYAASPLTYAAGPAVYSHGSPLTYAASYSGW